MVESFIIYNIFLLLILVLCTINWIVKRTYEINPAVIYFIILFLFILFNGLRYDVGTDYSGHLEDFINKSYSKFAPGFLLLNKLFFPVNYGFFFVILISCIITYSFIFENLRLNRIDYVAIPIFVCLFLFQFNNLIRQAISVSIFFYAIRFIHLRKPVVFFLLVLLASAFHSSALFLFPFYLIGRVKINRIVALVLVVIAFIIFEKEDTIGFILSKITGLPVYGHYVNTEFISSGDKNTGLGYLTKLCIGIILLLKKDENTSVEYNTYYNLFVISVILVPLANKIAVIDRINYYFYIAILYILPYYIINKSKSIVDYFLKFALIIFCLALFEAGLYFNTGKNSPYMTIFSNTVSNILIAP